MARRGFAGTRVTSGAAARPHRERCHAHADAHSGRAARIASRAACRFVASVSAPGSGAPGSGRGMAADALSRSRFMSVAALRPHHVIKSSGHWVIVVGSSRRRVVAASGHRGVALASRVLASSRLAVSQSRSLTGSQHGGHSGRVREATRRGRGDARGDAGPRPRVSQSAGPARARSANRGSRGAKYRAQRVRSSPGSPGREGR